MQKDKSKLKPTKTAQYSYVCTYTHRYSTA